MTGCPRAGGHDEAALPHQGVPGEGRGRTRGGGGTPPTAPPHGATGASSQGGETRGVPPARVTSAPAKETPECCPTDWAAGFPSVLRPPASQPVVARRQAGSPAPRRHVHLQSPPPPPACKPKAVHRRPPTVLGRERGGGASLLRQRPRGGTPRAETPSGAAARSWARAGGFFRPRFAHRALSCAAQGLQLTPACTWGGVGAGPATPAPREQRSLLKRSTGRRRLGDRQPKYNSMARKRRSRISWRHRVARGVGATAA